jgi:hypothetical protein
MNIAANGSFYFSQRAVKKIAFLTLFYAVLLVLMSA